MSRKRGNGEGTIHRRKSGCWCAQYTVYTAGGRKRKTVYGKTRQEVAAKLAKALSDQEGGLTFDAGNQTVGDYLNRWLYDSVRDTVRKGTFERHEQIVRLHIRPSLGSIKLKGLSPAQVQGFYREKLDSGLSPATVHKIHAVLHKALDQAVKWRLMTYNVSDVVTEPPQKRSERDALTLRQVWNFLEVAKGNVLRIHIVLTGQPTAPVL